MLSYHAYITLVHVLSYLVLYTTQRGNCDYKLYKKLSNSYVQKRNLYTKLFIRKEEKKAWSLIRPTQKTVAFFY